MPGSQWQDFVGQRRVEEGKRNTGDRQEMNRRKARDRDRRSKVKVILTSQYLPLKSRYLHKRWNSQTHMRSNS